MEAPKPEIAPAPNPMDALRETLGMAAMFKEALGLGGGQNKAVDQALIESIKAASAFQARFEMEHEHRKELRDPGGAPPPGAGRGQEGRIRPGV